MKILLITPPYHSGVLESAGRWPNLAFVYHAGHLRAAGHEAVIYDAMSTGDDLEAIRARIEQEQPDAVLTTAFTASYPAAVQVLRAAKEIGRTRGRPLVTGMGGVHATFMFEEILGQHGQWVDYCFLGEGEQTLPELFDVLSRGDDPAQLPGLAFRRRGRIRTTGRRPFVPDLDAIIPAWDLLDWHLYTFFVFPGSRMATINTSRGCSQACSFCSQQKFWEQTWRARRAEEVAAEILELNRDYGVDVFLISDELPTHDRERWETLLDLLIEAGSPAYLLMETRVDDIVRDEDILWKYRSAGVVHVYVGVEATSQEVLDLFKKEADVRTGKKAIELLAQHGILSETSFVLGTPDETPESVARTLEMAKFYNPDMAHFLLLAPWPYADMWPDLEPYVETRDYALYNLVEPVLRSRTMTRDELMKAVIDCYMDFYLSRIPRWTEEPDEFKREYLLRSARLIMQNSFVTRHLPEDFELPEEAKAAMEKAGC
ncbi:MAG: radical SAM protein [Thermoleophilia bacterium]